LKKPNFAIKSGHEHNNVIDVKWMFWTKLNADGFINKHRSGLW